MNVAAAQAFKSFARLWRFQQEHRAALTDAGLRRWEIGEIASRVGQLYYAFYLRTGEGWYLSESHAFFSAASKREYFAECHQTPALAQKRLRHRARHVVTCLLVDKLEEAREVVEAWRRDVDAYAADHRPADAAEWRAMTDDAAAFLEANVFASHAMGSIKSVSHGADRCPRDARYRADDQKRRGSLGDKTHASRQDNFKRRRLGGVVTCGTYPSQVRFGDWTLDAFRVHRACEWEDVTTSGNDDGAGREESFKRDERAEGVGAATPSASVASSPKGPPPTHHRARSRTISFSSAGSGFESSTLEGTTKGSSGTAESAGGLEQRPDDDERVSGISGRDETDVNNQTTARRSPTPRKYAVRSASARRFLLAAATACEELPRDQTLLLYLSARGGDRAAGAEAQAHASACPGLRLGTAAINKSVAGHFSTLSVGGEVSLDGFPSRLTGDTARGGWAAAAAAPSAADARSAAVRAQTKAEGQPTGRVARQNSVRSRSDPDLTLYPADLAPLTRRRLFVVVDADAARQFHLLSGYGPCGPTPGGETPVVLAAAPSAPPNAPPESKHGRFFTLFLTNPAAGARALCGLSLSSEVFLGEDDKRDTARVTLERVAETLLEADAAGALDPAWSDAVGDPFTLRFAAHFALCRALVAAHATTRSDISPRPSEETGAPSRFTPTCSPPLPASCDARACAPHAAAFAEALGLEREFRFA